MDLAVFSDIHSNYAALQACFDFCTTRGITHFLLLGDYVTDCPSPQKTMELLYILQKYFQAVFIRGNREEYLLNYRKENGTGWKKGSSSGSLLYTYDNLTERDFNFFDSLLIYGVYQEEGLPSFEYCHGSPQRAGELLFRGKRNTRKTLSSLKTQLLVHGHHHIQEVYEYREKKSLNPGSIGIPWYYEGKTQFAILHGRGTTWEEELIQLDYDRESLLEDFEQSGLTEMAPAWAAVTMHTVRTGRDLNETVKLRAMQLCREERGQAVWPDIPEEYWARALLEYRIDLKGREIQTKDGEGTQENP